MPLSSWNLQLLNHNSQRAYPLAAHGSATDTTGSIRIPDDLMVEFDLSVHAGHNIQPERFYLQSLIISPTGLNFGIGYNDGSATPPLTGVVAVAAGLHTEYLSYAVTGVGDFVDSRGSLTLGNLASIQQIPVGSYTFLPVATPFEIGTIRPMIRGITSLQVVNGGDRSPKIYGDVELVAGTNFSIAASVIDDTRTEIVFNAIAGEGLNEICACDEEGDGPSIRFINGIPPLSDGNFRMVGNACMDIKPVANGLQLSDLCSEPCCGCEELAAITQQLERFADGAVTLQRISNNLSIEVTQMSQVVLGSRLGGQGCVEC